MEKKRHDLSEKRFQGVSKFRQSSQYRLVEKFITVAIDYTNINPEGWIYSVGPVAAHSESLAHRRTRNT